MKINEYEIRDIVKRIYRLQLKFHKLCRKLGKIEVDMTPFGDYIGGLDFEDVLEEMDIRLDAESRNVIRWRLSYCDMPYIYNIKPDVYNGRFDLKYMGAFDFKQIILSYLEDMEADLKTEIDDQELRMAECYEKLDAINKIRQKWKTT